MLNSKLDDKFGWSQTTTLTPNTDAIWSCDYPAGFNGNNCVIISTFVHLINTSTGADLGWYYNLDMVNRSICTRADKIYGYQNSKYPMDYCNRPYKILLMKTS